jgi:hypothetical protein
MFGSSCKARGQRSPNSQRERVSETGANPNGKAPEAMLVAAMQAQVSRSCRSMARERRWPASHLTHLSGYSALRGRAGNVPKLMSNTLMSR